MASNSRSKILNYMLMRNYPNQPRLHGNGFLQLDLESGARLHIWDPLLAPYQQKVRTTIHDHRFSFVSEVVYGTQVHQPYALNEEGHTHLLYVPARREGTEDTKLVINRWMDGTEDGPVGFDPLPREEIERGRTYTFEYGCFHDTIPDGLCATLMYKTHEETLWVPRVGVPLDSEPDNNFDRDAVPKEVLWDIVRKTLVLIAVTGG